MGKSKTKKGPESLEIGSPEWDEAMLERKRKEAEDERVDLDNTTPPAPKPTAPGDGRL